MDKAISQLKLLIGNVYSDYRFIDQKRIGIWMQEGDYLNSKVEITLENDEIDYELKIYFKKTEEEILTPHEMFVFLHELSHIIILEKMRIEKGIDAVEKYINKYKDDIELLNARAQNEKWASARIQEEYEKIQFEKETDLVTKKLFNRYVRIASS